MECLDEEIKHRRETQTELELAKADREQLLNHYEREREVKVLELSNVCRQKISDNIIHYITYHSKCLTERSENLGRLTVLVITFVK